MPHVHEGLQPCPRPFAIEAPPQPSGHTENASPVCCQLHNMFPTDAALAKTGIYGSPTLTYVATPHVAVRAKKGPLSHPRLTWAHSGRSQCKGCSYTAAQTPSWGLLTDGGAPESPPKTTDDDPARSANAELRSKQGCVLVQAALPSNTPLLPHWTIPATWGSRETYPPSSCGCSEEGTFVELCACVAARSPSWPQQVRLLGERGFEYLDLSAVSFTATARCYS